MKSIQQLREQRQAAAIEARKLLESVEGKNWGSEDQEKYDRIMADIDTIDADIERHEKVLNLESKDEQRGKALAEQVGGSVDEQTHNVKQEKAIFNAFLRGGIDALTSEQRLFLENKNKAAGIQNAMSTSTPAEGGYLAPTDFQATLLEEMKAYGGMLSVATIINTDSGNTMEWPTVDETAQEGEIVGENATVARQDITFGVTNLDVYKYSSKDIAVPFELLMDSQVDLEAYIIRALAERIARIQNRHFTVGTATAQPQGAVTASALGKTGTTGQTTTVIYDDLVDLEHSIDPAYRAAGNARYMFHDTTLRALKKLRDADDRPLWVPGVAVSEPDTINGYAYTINQNMPVMAADAKSILFGDFSKYIIRNVMQTQLFRMTDSAFTRNGQVGFLAFARAGGKFIASSNSSLKHYANSST